MTLLIPYISFMWKNDSLLPLVTTIKGTHLTIWRCWFFWDGLAFFEAIELPVRTNHVPRRRLAGWRKWHKIGSFAIVCNGLPVSNMDDYDDIWWHMMYVFFCLIYLPHWNKIDLAPDSLHSHRPPFCRHGDLTGSNSPSWCKSFITKIHKCQSLIWGWTWADV